MAPLVSRWVLPMRAVARAHRVRASAAVAVSGVVASLSLAVALTVMVTSFRESVTYWLDVVLPADLYVRAATGAGTGETAFLTPQFVRAMQSVPGVQRVVGSHLFRHPARLLADIHRDDQSGATDPRDLQALQAHRPLSKNRDALPHPDASCFDGRQAMEIADARWFCNALGAEFQWNYEWESSGSLNACEWRSARLQSCLPERSSIEKCAGMSLSVSGFHSS